MKIFIQNLENGIYEFDETVAAENMALQDESISCEAINIHALVDRLEAIFRVKFTMETIIHQVCDRCLEKFDMNFREQTDRIYQIGDGILASDDEVEVLPEGTREIDLSTAIKESFIISRPIRIVCSETCKGLCPHCGVNLNQKQCSCITDTIDPRLEKLKLLLKEE